MSDTLALVVAISVGALLSTFFFGGLWWTIQKGVASDRPALWFLGSLLLRTSVLLAGFYFISHGHWPRFVACLLGFLIARVVVVTWLAKAAAERTPLEKGIRNAPQSR